MTALPGPSPGEFAQQSLGGVADVLPEPRGMTRGSGPSSES